MSIDFNKADVQKVNSKVRIPPGSKVYVSMKLVKPQNAIPDQPNLQKTANDATVLPVILTVERGRYAGAEFHHNFMLNGASNSRAEFIQRKSHQQLRAIIEFKAGIGPSDDSDSAKEMRVLKSWEELDGVKFFAEVSCVVNRNRLNEKTQRYYVNNKLNRVVTIEDSDYEELKAKGEFISNKPVPSGLSKAINSEGNNSSSEDIADAEQSGIEEEDEL